jgi:hypothetical protein
VSIEFRNKKVNTFNSGENNVFIFHLRSGAKSKKQKSKKAKKIGQKIRLRRKERP